MRKTPPAWMRLSLLCLLGLSLLVLIPTSEILRRVSGGTFWIAEKATAAFNDLRRGV